MNRVVLAFLLLLIKHFIGDYLLQSERQIRAKGIYGARPGLEHAGLHAVLTAPCLLAVGVPPIAVAVAVALEGLVHYHTDWLKARTERRRSLTTAGKPYWVLYGADQLVHQLTYVAMVWVLVAR
jgi:hypothetical protein